MKYDEYVSTHQLLQVSIETHWQACETRENWYIVQNKKSVNRVCSIYIKPKTALKQVALVWRLDLRHFFKIRSQKLFPIVIK